MAFNPLEAPPGFVARKRINTVNCSLSDPRLGCLENGGCAFMNLCPSARDRDLDVPGFPKFSCRPGFRWDGCRVTFHRAAFGNEEDA